MNQRWLMMAWYGAATGSAGAFPFLATALSARGASGPEIAALLVLFPVGVLLGGPLWGWLADRTGSRVLALRLSTGGGLLFWSLLLLTHDLDAMKLCYAAFALFRCAQAGLADATTLAILGEDRASYGRIRSAGSVGYALVVLLAGWMSEADPSAPLWLGLGFLAVSHGITWLLPGARVPPPPNVAGDSVLGHPVLLPLFALCLLHGIPLNAYDALFPLHVEQLGLPARVAGVAIALGVAVEVGVLIGARAVLGRVGPLWLLTGALWLSELRWLLTATITDAWPLAAVQALHGVCFGGFWIAAVALVGQYVPPGRATTALALLPGVTFGGGPLVMMTIARFALADGTVADLYRLGCVVQLAALAMLVLVARGVRQVEADPPTAQQPLAN